MGEQSRVGIGSSHLCVIYCMITGETLAILVPGREGGKPGRGTFEMRRHEDHQGDVDEYLCGEHVL